MVKLFKDGHPYLDLRDLTVEVARHEVLTQQFRTVHFRLCTALAVIAAPSSPERAIKVFSIPAEPRSPQCLVARNCTCGDGLAEFPVLAGWNDGGSTPCSTSFGVSFGDGIVALARVAGPVCSNAGDVVIGWDLARVWLSNSGSMGASPTSLLATSTARISSVWSPIPRWTFYQTRSGPSTRRGVLAQRACAHPIRP